MKQKVKSALDTTEGAFRFLGMTLVGTVLVVTAITAAAANKLHTALTDAVEKR